MNTKLCLAALLSILIAINPVQSRFDPLSIAGSNIDELQASDIFPLTGAVGPESIAFDPNGGGPYTGVADGRILKWNGNAWVDFAFTGSQREECGRPVAPEMEHVCGRPLGLRFDTKTGELYIADAYFGVRVVGPGGGPASEVVTEAENQTLYFTNDLDIDELGDTIYFTDASKRFQRRQFLESILSGDKTGRFMKYDRSTKEVKVLLRDLGFANGVALSKDRSFVLVAETGACRIIRFWLRGPNAGTSHVFAELPGFPDNIRMNSEGEFWVALISKRGLVSNFIVSDPWTGHATAVKLSESGEVVRVLEDCGDNVGSISEVGEMGGKLWIGSVLMPFMAMHRLG